MYVFIPGENISPAAAAILELVSKQLQYCCSESKLYQRHPFEVNMYAQHQFSIGITTSGLGVLYCLTLSLTGLAVGVMGETWG